MAAKAFGMDVSRHQGEIDWPLVAQQGVLFAGIRASVSDYYIDETFKRNYDGAVAAGIIPLPYWVIRFDRPSDPQADKYLEALDGRQTWLDVCDVELEGGADKSVRGRILHYGMQRVEQSTSAMGSIYTRKSFWDSYMPSQFLQKFNTRWLWIASYGGDRVFPYKPASPPFPTWPADWAEWSIWQWSQRWKLEGVESAAVDADDMSLALYTALRARSGILAPVIDGDPVPDPEPVPGPGPVEPDPNEAPEGGVYQGYSLHYKVS